MSQLTAQQKRRRTLFPLSSQQVCRNRSRVAANLRAGGFSVYEIRQILNCSPETARRYIAKGSKA